MAFYLVKFDGGVHANDELYIAALAGGEKAFMKMLANKVVVGKKIFDQTLYPLTGEQEKRCLEYSPAFQDFEDFFKHLNVVSGDVIRQLREKECSFLPNATLIPISANIITEQYKYRQVIFFRVRDFKESRKYKMLTRMAAVKVCGFLYTALNAVDIRVETPIVVTLKK